MVNCKGCGAGISVSDKECPYCGHSVIQRAQALENQESTYTIRRGETTTISFGDGQTGSRLSSGKRNVSSQYRHGAGSGSGNLSKRIEKTLDQLYQQIKRVPDPSKQKGSKDLGVVLVESMGTIGDLLSLYQTAVSREAHLSTKDRKRISKKEDRVRPKLKSLAVFCERVNSKTQKKMGLSDLDIRKIRAAAVKAIQAIESGKCSKCDTMNRPGTTRCQRCDAPL
ncbi:MAG: hypothetical protein ACTSQZ_01395 [Candidatus Thorarchaeota archaeon]